MSAQRGENREVPTSWGNASKKFEGVSPSASKHAVDSRELTDGRRMWVLFENSIVCLVVLFLLFVLLFLLFFGHALIPRVGVWWFVLSGF
ncbi:MAG: hypothetical protein J2P17_06365, partial [Mycobacterium sp.]|nr:hypothetical protein [Mycobacterium sp.]